MFAKLNPETERTAAAIFRFSRRGYHARSVYYKWTASRLEGGMAGYFVLNGYSGAGEEGWGEGRGCRAFRGSIRGRRYLDVTNEPLSETISRGGRERAEIVRMFRGDFLE